jgi:uncharacterized membrane protein YgdD (TMEM256/DUF423 family)
LLQGYRLYRATHGIPLSIMGEAADRPSRLWLTAAAVNGFIAVAMGAFAAHGLKDTLPAEALDWVRTGSSYQMWHALAFFAVAVLPGAQANAALRVAGCSFLAGCVLFSGSLYLLALSGWRGFALVTPVGGGAFLIGWAALAWHGITRGRPI